jgi:hypothetical protein
MDPERSSQGLGIVRTNNLARLSNASFAFGAQGAISTDTPVVRGPSGGQILNTLHFSLFLAVISCLMGAGLGALALLRPAKILLMVGLSLRQGVSHSISEVRATYGGLFFVSHSGTALALALSPKIGACMAAALGLAWSGAAFGRVVSMISDRLVTRHNIGATAFEALMGLTLATPLWAYMRLIHQALKGAV